MAEDQEHKAARTAAISRALKSSFATTAGETPEPSEAQARAAGVLDPLRKPKAPPPPPEKAEAKKAPFSLYGWESQDAEQIVAEGLKRRHLPSPFDAWVEGDTGDTRDTGDTGDAGDTGDTGEPEPRLRTGEWLRQKAEESGIVDPGSSIIDTNTEVYAPHIEGSDEMDPEALRQAAEAAAVENYFSEYSDTTPVSSSSMEIDGKPGERRVYKDGAVFLVVPADDPRIVLRQKNEGE